VSLSQVHHDAKTDAKFATHPRDQRIGLGPEKSAAGVGLCPGRGPRVVPPGSPSLKISNQGGADAESGLQQLRLFG
jgi:hypothetical protein